MWRERGPHDTEDRFYVVNPAQNGDGYYVTRYDVRGTFTTIPGAHHPGDCANTFDSEDHGTFNGVWTRHITSDLTGFDFNRMPCRRTSRASAS